MSMNVGDILRPRWMAALAYIAYLSMAIAFMFFSSPSLADLLGKLGIVVWNMLLLWGSLTALFGALTKWYWIEIIGLPGTITGLLVYALYIGVAAFSPNTDSNGVAFGIACVFFGAAIGMIGRLYEVYHRARISGRIGKRVGDGNG